MEKDSVRTWIAVLGKIALAIFAVAFAAIPKGFSQPRGPAWELTRAKLASLQTCLGSQNSDLDDLSHGLQAGWGPGGERLPMPEGSKSATPPPPEYLNSLDRDIEACNFAATRNDPAQRQAILDAVARDIQIKAEDCRKHGMGRTVSVRVSTVKAGAPVSGWEVFYTWICSCGFGAAELRANQLTSPAIIPIAAGSGTWSIRAQKISLNGVMKSGPVVIPVPAGAPETVDLQLPIQ